MPAPKSRRQCLSRLAIAAALASTALFSLPMPCISAPKVPVYQNPSAPLNSRVNDLFKRLTQEEKLSMLSGTPFTSQPLPRLGLKGMQFADAGQGVRGGTVAEGVDPIAGPATAFPAGISMATSWDRDLVNAIGKAIGEEARNKGIGIQIELGPAVNIHRSPLCGRDSEYLSEDPYLNARLAVQYIEGMQSTGTGACVKHFACNNEEVDRGEVNVVVDERTLREIYLPAFEAAVKEAHVRSIMAAYNKVNGPYCTANWFLLNNVLRGDWKFDGLVMSDWGAVHTTAAVINGGTDLEMPGPGDLVAKNLQQCLSDGSIKQSEIDHAVKDILRATIRSGIADPVQPVPDHAVVGNAAHRAIALRAGQEGMILLKNEGSLLPIDPNAIKTIAIIGPRAKNWQYNAHGSPGLTPTVLVGAYNGIAARLAGNSNVNILYASGSDTEGKPIPTEDLITVDGKEHGLHAEYFNNQTLSGNPLITQTDKLVDFDWSNDPRPTGIPPEHFSARWTGNVTAPVSGTYTFSVQVDDGARLWVNNKLLADDWKDGGLRYITGKIDMTAGQSYSLKLEYFQDGGGANASLLWLLPSDGSDPVQRASAIAAQADVAIVIVGGQEETEGTDRSSMDLPDKQDDLIKAIVKANPHTVVVLNNGGPLLVNSWLDDVPSVLDAGFSGELGGDALASILFGDVSPSGKLVDTYGMRREDYPDYGNFPGVKNVVHYNEGIYVGYRAFDKRQVTPQFPFGYGLSYTTFQYSHLKIARNAWKASGNMVVTAEITNTGKRAGAEIAELYIEPKSPLIDRPIRELKGFDRLELAPGQTKTAKFTLTPRDFAYCDVPGKQWRADSGDYVIEVGASSRNLLLQSKVLLTDTWTDPIPGIGAVDPYKAVSSLSTGKPATASSTYQAHDVVNAFDEDPSTRWESTWTDPQWLEVDLQQSTTFTHVQIAWETAYSSDFELQVSDDNSTWKTIYTDINGQGGIQQIRFPKVTARYVRLYMNKRASKFGDSIFDFDVFEK